MFRERNQRFAVETRPLAQRDGRSRGGNAVHDHLERARAGLAALRDIEFGVGGTFRPHAHGGEVVAPGVADVARAGVGDADNRIVGRGLCIVAIDAAQIEAIEVCARDGVARAADRQRRVDARYHRQPTRLGMALWLIDRDLGAGLTVVPQGLARRKHEQVTREVGTGRRRLVVGHLCRGYLAGLANRHLPEVRRIVERARACLSKNVAAWQRYRRSVLHIVHGAADRYLRPVAPRPIGDRINVTDASARVAGHLDDRAAFGSERSLRRRAKFIGGGRAQVIDRVSSLAPGARRGVVGPNFVTGGGVIPHIDQEHVAVRQRRETLFVHAWTAAARPGVLCGSPSHGRAADRGRYVLASTKETAVAKEKGAIRQDEAFRIPNAVPAARRGYRTPFVGDRIIDRALVRPVAAAAVIFAAFDQHVSVGQNLRGVEVGLIAARHRSDLLPAAACVLALLVRREFVPRTGGAGERVLDDDGAVGQQQRSPAALTGKGFILHVRPRAGNSSGRCDIGFLMNNRKHDGSRSFAAAVIRKIHQVRGGAGCDRSHCRDGAKRRAKREITFDFHWYPLVRAVRQSDVLSPLSGAGRRWAP